MTSENDIAEQKKALRQEIFARRRTMTDDQRSAKSDAICQELIERLQPGKQQVIGVYSALTQEVSLHHFIDHAFQQGALIAFPCMRKPVFEGQSQFMEMRCVSYTQYLAAVQLQRWKRRTTGETKGANLNQKTSDGSINSMQHTAAPFVANPMLSFSAEEKAFREFPLVDPRDLTALICPLVAFDSNSNRLGYGGGNYDRYLPRLSDTCQVIGVAFAEQEVKEVPVEEHDCPIDIISR